MEQAIVKPNRSYADAVKELSALGYEGLVLPAYAPGVEYGPAENRRTSDGKHTFALGVSGRKARPVTKADVDGWCAREARAAIPFNALLKCGSVPGRPGLELAFLDVDGPDHAAGRSGADSLAAFAKERELTPLPLESMVRNTNRTPESMEGHYGILVPAGRGWATPDGVDWIGVGIRTIVAPGSAHKSGRHYRILRGTESVAMPRIDEWPTLPQEWVDALSTPHVEASHEAGEWQPKPSGGRWCRIVKRVYEQYAIDPMRGRSSRHEGMQYAMAHLAHLAAEGHRGAEEAAERIAQGFGAVTGSDARVEEAMLAMRDAWARHGGSGAGDPCDSWAPAPVETRRTPIAEAVAGFGLEPKRSEQPAVEAALAAMRAREAKESEPVAEPASEKEHAMHEIELPSRAEALARLSKAGIPEGIAATVAEICETGDGFNLVHPAWLQLAAGEITAAPPEAEIDRWRECADGHWRCW